MIRKIIVCIVIFGLLGIAGCGQTGEVIRNSENELVQTELDIKESPESEMFDSSDSVSDAVDEEQSDSANSENNDIGLNDGLEIDFAYDYSEDIKTDVASVVSDATSLQEELENIKKRVFPKYTVLAQKAQTQVEMNQSSCWFYAIWDTELNNLWDRISDSADEQTKERLLTDQRNWIAMKEEAVLENIGSREENGSMYPLLVNSFMEEITEHRAYILANELAKIKGECFVMPEISVKYGYFADNQGTGSIYSFLLTRQDWEQNDEAIISVYRIGEIRGTFIDNGNGELAFTSNDGDVKGTIKNNGWDGASFTVTETSEESIFSVGEEFQFPFVF